MTADAPVPSLVFAASPLSQDNTGLSDPPSSQPLLGSYPIPDGLRRSEQTRRRFAKV